MNGYIPPVYGAPIQPAQGFMIVPTGVPGMMPGAYNAGMPIGAPPPDRFDASGVTRYIQDAKRDIQTYGANSNVGQLRHNEVQQTILGMEHELLNQKEPYDIANQMYTTDIAPLMQGVAPQAANGITPAPGGASSSPVQTTPANTTAPAAPTTGAPTTPAATTAQALPGGLGVDPNSGLLITAETDPATNQPVMDPTNPQQPKTRPLTFAEASSLPVFAKPDANGDGVQEIIIKQGTQELPLTSVAIPQGSPEKPNDIQVNPQDQAVMLNGAPLNASQLLYKPGNFAQAQTVSTYDPQTGQVVSQPVQQSGTSTAPGAATSQPGQPSAQQLAPEQIEAVLTQATDPAIASQAAAQVDQAIKTATGNEGVSNPAIGQNSKITQALSTMASNPKHPLQGQALDGLTRLEVQANLSAAKKKKASALTSFQKAKTILNAKLGAKNSPLPADPAQAQALKSVALGSLLLMQGAPGAPKDGAVDKLIASAQKAGVQTPVNSMPATAGQTAPGQRLTAFA